MCKCIGADFFYMASKFYFLYFFATAHALACFLGKKRFCRYPLHLITKSKTDPVCSTACPGKGIGIVRREIIHRNSIPVYFFQTAAIFKCAQLYGADIFPYCKIFDLFTVIKRITRYLRNSIRFSIDCHKIRDHNSFLYISFIKSSLLCPILRIISSPDLYFFPVCIKNLILVNPVRVYIVKIADLVQICCQNCNMA